MHEPQRSILWLSALVLFKAAYLASLYRRGFLSVSADEFSRGVRNAHWAIHPTFAWSDFLGVWLPPERFLNGTAMMVWPDPIWAPRATAFLASCVLLFALYRLVRLLFEPWPVAALTSLLLVVQPWYTWLSGTPALDIYYLPFFFLGLGFLVEWLRDDRPGRWLAAALCFLGASGFHVQSWLLINLVHALTLGFFIRQARRRDWNSCLRLTALYVVSDALMIAVAIGGLLSKGAPLTFIADHTSYSKWFYQGYDVSVGAKLAFYPRLLSMYLPPTARLLLLASVIFTLREHGRMWKLAPLVLGVASLAAYSVFNVTSVPPTAAPERYTLLWTMLALPAIAHALYRLGTAGFAWRPGYARALSLATASLLLGVLVYANLAIARHIPDGIPWDPVLMGRELSRLMDEPGASRSRRLMVELSYWDFLGVELAAGHYDRICYDRERDRQRRDLPSLFVDDPSVIRARLAEMQVEWVVLKSPELTRRADALPWLTRIREQRGWTLFEVRLPAGDDGRPVAHG